MAESSKGPEIVTKFSVDLSEIKKGSAEAKQEIKGVSAEADRATGSGKGMAESMTKAGSSMKSLGDISDKASAILGGTFVTAALAIVGAIAAANAEVEGFDKSVRISSGTQQNYAVNMASLDTIADKYKKNIFELAGGFNELARETRGTALEGKPTAEIFDTIVSVSKKMGVAVDDTTGSLTGFIDKMKQGTVDSTSLSNEVDKRLYEAFSKVSESMGLTNEELNKVLKTSDEAVSTVLPKLAEELSNAMGDIPQKDAHDLGEAVGYATGKLTILLDSLFQTSGVKSFLAQAAEDAGGLMDQLALLAKERGVTGVALGLMDAGAETLLNGTGFQGPSLKYARDRNQVPLMGKDFKLPGDYMFAPKPLSDGESKILQAAEKLRAKEAEEANKKRIADAKRHAADRKREEDAIVKQEIYESEQRIRTAILATKTALDELYSKNHSVISPVGMITPKGITTGLDNNLNKTQKFTNDTGQGPNLDHVTSQIESQNKAWWDNVVAQKEAARTSNDTAISLESLGETLKKIGDQAKMELFVGFGETLGQLSVDATSVDNIKNKIAMTMGDLISSTGKAIVAWAITQEGLQKTLEATFSNPYVALAVGVAAIAAGAALKASAGKAQKNAAQRLWTGGEVIGRAGIDTVPTMLTPGEVVTTSADQNKFIGAIKGISSGRDLTPRTSSGSTGNSTMKIEVFGQLNGSVIELASRQGSKDNKHFE